MSKKLASLLIAGTLVLAFALAACGGGGGSTAGSTAASEPQEAGSEPAAATTSEESSSESEEGTITFLAPEYSSKTEGFWNEVIGEFEKTNPGEHVNLQMVAWPDLPQKITTLISTNQAPDILGIDSFAQYAEEELLLPAEQVLSPETANSFTQTFAEHGDYEGTQYAIPWVGSVRTLFYNKAMFKEAGISAPPKTWSELRDDAKKITDGGNIGYGMPLGKAEADAEFSLWMWGNGGSWTGSGEKLSINQPANVEALEEMQKLSEEGLTQPNPGTTERDDLWKTFGAGQVGMIEGASFLPGILKEQNPKLDFGVAPAPSNPPNPSPTLGVEDYLMVFASSDHPNVDKAFLDHVFTPAVYEKFIELEGFLPVIESVSAKLASSDHEQAVFIEAAKNAQFYPDTNPVWGSVEPQIREQLGTAMTGSSAKDVLDGLQETAEQAEAEAQR